MNDWTQTTLHFEEPPEEHHFHVVKQKKESLSVLLCNGFGSWGYGIWAARHFVVHVKAGKWLGEYDFAEMIRKLVATAHRSSLEMQDYEECSEFDEALFEGLLLHFSGQQLRIAMAGFYTVTLRRGGKVIQQTKVRTFLDRILDTYSRTESDNARNYLKSAKEDVTTGMFHNLYAGPLLGKKELAMQVESSWLLQQGDEIQVAYHRGDSTQQSGDTREWTRENQLLCSINVP